MKKSYKIAGLVALVALVALGVSFSGKKTALALPVPPAAAPLVPVPVAVPAPKLLSFSFDQVPLGDLVAFVAGSSPHYHFVFSGLSGSLVSWAEYGLSADKLLSSFLSVLFSAGFTVSQTGLVFTIVKTAAVPTFQPVDFLRAGERLFFQYQGVIYSADKMPVPVQSSGGRWFALTPAPTA